MVGRGAVVGGGAVFCEGAVIGGGAIGGEGAVNCRGAVAGGGRIVGVGVITRIGCALRVDVNGEKAWLDRPIVGARTGLGRCPKVSVVSSVLVSKAP